MLLDKIGFPGSTKFNSNSFPTAEAREVVIRLDYLLEPIERVELTQELQTNSTKS